MSKDRLYLVHIGECITRIKEYTVGGKDVFLSDPRTQDAVMRNLQTLAESTQRLSEDVRARHPDVNWRGIAGFRNVLVHGYLGVNPVRIWQIVEVDLPTLEQQITEILGEEITN